MTDIAIFPIPNSVSFPGTIVPLHVFEPRYRAMINHCVEAAMPLAVAHTEKTIRQAPVAESPKEALQQNAATYKPCTIFSAGPCEIEQTLPDGRLLVEVSMEKRYRSLEKIQSLPFEIHRCAVLEDDPLDAEGLHQAKQLKEKVLRRLMALSAGSKDLEAVLTSESLVEMPIQAFSFSIFQLVQLGAYEQQDVLEMRSPITRLEHLLTQLNQLTT